jgi:hypothetical protein
MEEEKEKEKTKEEIRKDGASRLAEIFVDLIDSREEEKKSAQNSLNEK